MRGMCKSRLTALSQLPWQVGSAPRQPFGPCPADDMASVSEWLTARVPGDVRADLVAARRLAALETPQGIAASEWVDDCDWWYRVTVPGALSPDEILIVEADGIDYYSAIWLDDRLLATHAGMFSRQTVLLSPHINNPGRTNSGCECGGVAHSPVHSHRQSCEAFALSSVV
jgi:hypothetical protein